MLFVTLQYFWHIRGAWETVDPVEQQLLSFGYIGVTLMLHWSYIVVILVLHWCYIGVTLDSIAIFY